MRTELKVVIETTGMKELHENEDGTGEIVTAEVEEILHHAIRDHLIKSLKDQMEEQFFDTHYGEEAIVEGYESWDDYAEKFTFEVTEVKTETETEEKTEEKAEPEPEATSE